jgi:hypothetical protein
MQLAALNIRDGTTEVNPAALLKIRMILYIPILNYLQFSLQSCVTDPNFTYIDRKPPPTLYSSLPCSQQLAVRDPV